MKQKITVKQITSLSDEALIRYCAYIEEMKLGAIPSCHKFIGVDGKTYSYPEGSMSMNIGQMIEFLGRNTTGYIGLPTGHDGEILTDEFCDDLWEECKRELNG